MSETENKELAKGEGSNEFVEDGRNKLIVKCKYCGSKMLDKKSADYIIQEVLLLTSTYNFRSYLLINTA